jgi:hypothetical protein
MKKICSFNQYLEGARTSSSKTGLYPLGYGGIGLYPDSDYLTHAADAILYLTIDKRLYHNGDNPPFDITHLPGHKDYGDRVNNGESEPFDIRNIPGKPVPPKGKMPPGKTTSFKDFVKLVQQPSTVSPTTKMPQ